MYYDVGDSEALLQAVRIKIEFLAPRVVQAKFREIAKTITKPRFSIFLAISRTPKKMSEPGAVSLTFINVNATTNLIFSFLNLPAFIIMI
ncbi:MAG: hypothetical protein HEQ20_09185 [Aphanizomenon flos-aquae KM1D3_PB]|nr:MAG: hypothetical protein HEQ20_09185 [Aphanizomenon flos-aquae KM1D3_PB]